MGIRGWNLDLGIESWWEVNIRLGIFYERKNASSCGAPVGINTNKNDIYH